MDNHSPSGTEPFLTALRGASELSVTFLIKSYEPHWRLGSTTTRSRNALASLNSSRAVDETLIGSGARTTLSPRPRNAAELEQVSCSILGTLVDLASAIRPGTW